MVESPTAESNCGLLQVGLLCDPIICTFCCINNCLACFYKFMDILAIQDFHKMFCNSCCHLKIFFLKNGRWFLNFHYYSSRASASCVFGHKTSQNSETMRAFVLTSPHLPCLAHSRSSLASRIACSSKVRTSSIALIIAWIKHFSKIKIKIVFIAFLDLYRKDITMLFFLCRI